MTPGESVPQEFSSTAPLSSEGLQPRSENVSSHADPFSLERIEATKTGKKRMRNIFLGSLGLSVLIVLHLVVQTSLAGRASSILGVSFPMVLAWSLTLTVYAFHVLWRLLEQDSQLLQQMAITDHKTGVKSLDYIRTFLQEEHDRSIQTGQPVAVLYVDLQNLNLVNQNFGHAVGDIVLRDVAGTIEGSVPQEGVVGHVAGDEFLVVLPGANSEKAKSVAEAIEQGIGQYRVDLGKKRQMVFLGCRIGVIECPPDVRFADGIISAAQKVTSEPRTESHKEKPQEAR